MIFRRPARFRRAFRALPREIQEKAFKAFELFEQNPRHQSLVIKKIKGREGIWEGRIDQSCRFTFHYEQDASGETICVCRNVDSHDECLRNP